MKLYGIAICVLLGTLVTGQTGTPSADPETRAREIVAQMTLDEKITELHGIKDDTHYRYVPPIPRLRIPG